MSEQYEFDETQNKVISDLAHKMKFVSVFLIVIGALEFGFGILLLIQQAQQSYIVPLDNFISGIIHLLLGIWGMKAAGYFQKVVDTQGNDIDHLMSALGNLKNVVSLAYWLLVLFLLAFIIGIILAIVLGGASPPPTN